MEVLNIKFLNKSKAISINKEKINFIKSFVFGVFFSISWTPCVGAFLSSALLLIANEQNIIKGITLMLIYCFGLGIPFLISALIIDKMKKLFDFIKNNYNIIKKISGIILILMGLYTIFI